MKRFKRLAIGLAIFLLTLTFCTWLFIKSTHPQMDGYVPLKSLEQKVNVIRDQYGIPHIQASNKKDALRALGFVVASDRLFQMELARRLTQGKLSEVFGSAALKSDILYRSLMIEKSVRRSLDQEKAQGQFDQSLWDEMLSFCDGVNQFIETQPLPLELRILGLKPDPLTPIDAFIMTGHMAYSFGIATRADPLMTELFKELGPKVQSLRNDPISPPGMASKFYNPLYEIRKSLEQDFFPTLDGSNGWLLGPKMSASGKPLFANDPHIGFSMPSVWIEVHIQTPELNLYGHYLPLIPFAVLGHTLKHAWGFTMSLTDDMDLYQETLDRNSKKVLFEKTWVPYVEWQEVIKVKNMPNHVLTMIETQHGPLLSEALGRGDISLKWAFHRPGNNPMKSLREMAVAQNIDEFEKALQHGSAPGLNVLYADEKNIAWWMFGDLAIKKNPNSDFLFDGASGKDEYVGLTKWTDKPHLVNPPSGIIVSANARPQGLSSHIRGDWQSSNRFDTIEKTLSEKSKWTIDDVKQLQTRNYNHANVHILSVLLANLKLPAQEPTLHQTTADKSATTTLVKILNSWNHESNIDSQGAALFHQWNNEVLLKLLAPLSEAQREAYLDTPYAWIFYERQMKDLNSTWWQDRAPELITEAFFEMAKKMSKLPQWGDIHTIEYTHPLGRFFPLNYFFNVGPLKMGGAYNDITNNKMKALGSDFKVRAGASTRRVIDLDKPQQSWGINPVGVSGHLFSEFHHDQADLFIRGEHRPQLMDEAAIKKSQTHLLILDPYL